MLWYEKLFAKIASCIKIACFKLKYGSRISIDPHQRIWEKDTQIVIEKNCTVSIGKKINFRSHLTLRSVGNGRLEIGDYFVCNRNVDITARESIIIGKNCKIANNVVITDHDHDYKNNHVGYQSAPITIGDSVWIGANSVVLKGVTIGEHSVIAAGSVVNKDIPPYCIAAGVPARVIKEKLNEQ